jgi:uncharacterized membrane protein
MTLTLAALHPFLVHFAVAFAMASAAFDVADFFLPRKTLAQTGFILMLLALPFLLLAVLSGNLAEPFVRTRELERTLHQHETYANLAVWTFCAAALWRVFMVLKKQYAGLRRVAYIFVITFAAVSVFLTAKKGGGIRHHGYTTPDRIIAVSTFLPQRVREAEIYFRNP